MQTGLTRKLDYEKGKLKSKALQPDYRDRIAEEGDHFERGGSDGNQITLRDTLSGGRAFLKIWRNNKATAVDVYIQKIRGLLVKVGQWKFKFRISLAEFARENGLSTQDAARLLPSVKQEATERLAMTSKRAREAELKGYEQTDSRTGKSQLLWCLKFRTFLPTVEPVEWGKIYKRIELCPTEQESND